MSLFVGVDAGGTSTNVVAEGDGVRGAFAAEGANVRRLGIDGAAAVIARAVSSACEGRRPDRVVVGAAGAGHPEIAAGLSRVLSEKLSGSEVSVTDDAFIALRAATSGDGIVVIAGTGSIAYAHVAERAYRAGGHGFLLGDEGSGAAIGSAAVRLLLRAYEGRAVRDGFIEAIESLLDADDAEDVKQAIYDDADPVTKLASVAPSVLACASAGERSATKIVQAAALELFDLLKSVVRQAQAGDRDLPVVLAGGLLSENSLLTYLLETRISNEFPHLNPRKNAPPAQYGALELARAMR